MFKLTTKSGKEIPLIGLGTAGLQMSAFDNAIKVGYRLIDSSDYYDNE